MRENRTYFLVTLEAIVLSAVVLLIASCSGGEPPTQKESPAHVENPVSESKLATVTLTPAAEERLGIETAVASYQPLPGYLELGGEIIALPGTAVRVSAPVAGTVLLLRSGAAVQAGSVVKRGQEIMRLLLLPAEKDLVGTWEDVAVKQVEYEVAQAKVKRTETLLKDNAISLKAHQEAVAASAVANAALKAAKAKLTLLSGSGFDSEAIDQSTLVIKSPIGGVVQDIFVASGQAVPASTNLFEIVSQKPVWIRVPVYSGHLAKIARDKAARVFSLGAGGESASDEAQPVKGPLLSDSQSASSVLFFRCENSEGRYRIGERVTVKLTLVTESESLVIPWSSIVHDIYDGTWVYVKTAPHTYSRRRVGVSRIVDDLAVIERGLEAGDEVVTTAVAELYGTEFGGGK